MKSTSRAPIPADSSAPAAARAPNGVSVSRASAYDADMMPARAFSFPTGIPNAASTSSDGIVLVPKITCEETRNAEVEGPDMNEFSPQGFKIVSDYPNRGKTAQS